MYLFYYCGHLRYLTVNLCALGNQLFTPTFVSISNYPQNITFLPSPQEALLNKMLQLSFHFVNYFCPEMHLTKDKLPNDKSVSNICVLETDFLGPFGSSLIFKFHSTECEQRVVPQIGRSRVLKYLLCVDHIWCRSLAPCLVKHLVKTAIAELPDSGTTGT